MPEITNAAEARTALTEGRDNGGWTNGQLCWHIAFGAGAGGRTIARLRQNKGLNPAPPLMMLFNLMSLWMVRIRSRNATPQSVLAFVDEGYESTLQLVDTVQDDEWGNGAVFLGDYMTVGGAFAFMGDHIAEHAAEMRRG